MGKVVGQIAGAAVSYYTGGVLGAVLGVVTSSVVSRAFSGGERSEVQDEASRGTLINTASNVEALSIVYGRKQIGGPRVLTEVTGSDNRYLNLVFALCEGEIEGIDEIYLDGRPWDADFWRGLVGVLSHTGADDQAADEGIIVHLGGKWTDQHKGSGVAYVFSQLAWHPDVFANIPLHTFDVRGLRVYDPRSLATAFSDNPALAIRDYLTNTRYGRGIPESAIDDDAIIAAANYCDELVDVPDGAGGTTTQARYVVDIVLSPDDGHLENLRRLLATCRGMLVWSAGQYRLVLDKAETATGFVFDDSNIVGGWQINTGGKRARKNRVKARFFNPFRDWQPDILVYDNPTHRAEDGDALLELEIKLDGVSCPSRVHQIAQQEQVQSRFGITCVFRATVEGLRCEVGDVVQVTHATPGWTLKKFRVMQLDLLSSDEVEVQLREYDDSVYDLTLPPDFRPAPATNLPDPFDIGVPGNPAITEELYETSGSAGAKSRAIVTWVAPSDVFVSRYELQYKAIADSEWTAGATTSATRALLADLVPGRYSFRARAINTFEVHSDWSGETPAEIIGLTAPPADVTSFAAVNNAGLATAAWDLHPDLDVRQGGRIVVRHSPLTTGATWADGIIVGEFSGAEIRGLVPARTGTYLAKAVDSSDNWSTTAASQVFTEAMLAAPSTLATLTEHAAFSGTKTNTTVSASKLQLSSGTTFDSLSGNVDSFSGNWDALGGQATLGYYESSTYIDRTTVAARRWEASIKAAGVDNSIYWDELAGNLDDLDGYIDGAEINDANVEAFIATTDDNPAGAPTWSSWIPFHVGEFSCRAAKFRLALSVDTPRHNVQVSELSFAVRA